MRCLILWLALGLAYFVFLYRRGGNGWFDFLPAPVRFATAATVAAGWPFFLGMALCFGRDQ